MTITIWSLKGGVGKTSIALNLALSRKYKIITNESYSLLPKILDNDSLIQLEPSQKIPRLKRFERVIFDMGGTVDKRVVDCIEQSDFVLIPTTGNDIDIQGCIGTINELKEYVNDKNIIVVVNNTTNKKDFRRVKSMISLICECNFFEIKRSRGLVNIFDKKKSIEDLTSEGGLNANYYDKVNKQFKELIKFIED